ncbi:MAG TPA: chloride channel protein [Leucothrix mucor]|nr:chloride channel protein [Leucothrix mucor]
MTWQKLIRALNPVELLRRDFFIYIFIGLLCGTVAVIFHLSIRFVFDSLREYQNQQTPWTMLALMVIAPAIGGLFIGLIVQYVEPRAAGGGIPQTKVAYWNNNGILTIKEAFWRFVLTVISLGSGGSLGREGPTVHLCASIASQVGQWLKLRKEIFQSMIPVGMGAGLAAAFNTPLAAITFVIEEILLHDYKAKAIGGIIFAAVTAAAVERIVLGSNPVYVVHLLPFEINWWMLICLPIGVLGGVFAHIFVTGLLTSQQFFKNWKQCPNWGKPAVGGLAMGMTGTMVFVTTGHDGLFGLGYNDFTDTLSGNIFGITLVVLFVGKIIATILSFSSGGSGGLIAPSLYIGMMLGGSVGSLLVHFFDLSNSIVGGAALLGMGAFFAGVIRVPFTSVLLVYEMTGNYSLILPLMFGNMLAYNIAERLRPTPLHEALLIQNGIHLNYQSPPSR